MSTPGPVIVEVGPRDGLQSEAVLVPTETKIRFIDALSAAGHARIEATAFVSPKWVPQLADAEEVMQGIKRPPHTRFSVLVPNLEGLERALEAAVDEVAVFTAASETFTRRNVNASIDESFERFRPVAEEAQRAGVLLRGYVSTVLHCPYEGRVDPERTVEIVARLFDLGCHEVSLGETVGQATPNEVTSLCERLEGRGLLDRCAGHFHDTYGMGTANVWAAWQAGIRVFDASAGGLGGCPYAPGAAGNTATEDLLHLFRGLGVETGIDLDKQLAAADVMAGALDHPLPGRAYRALRGGGTGRAPL